MNTALNRKEKAGVRGQCGDKVLPVLLGAMVRDGLPWVTCEERPERSQGATRTQNSSSPLRTQGLPARELTTLHRSVLSMRKLIFKSRRGERLPHGHTYQQPGEGGLAEPRLLTMALVDVLLQHPGSDRSRSREGRGTPEYSNDTWRRSSKARVAG